MSNKITLKPFKRGKDSRRNTNGRPVGSISITKRIKKELAKIPEGSKETYLELMIKRILSKAIKEGDVQMLKLIWGYVDGLPISKTDITSDQKPIPILGGMSSLKDENEINNKKDD